MFDKILEGYKKNLIGKEFVYTSKYGGTVFGTVANVMMTQIDSIDAESFRKFSNKLNKKSGKYKSQETPIQVERSYYAHKPEISIFSKNGVLYNLNEDNIYFINS